MDMAESDSRSQPDASWCPPLSRCQMLNGQEAKAQICLAWIHFVEGTARTLNREGSSLTSFVAALTCYTGQQGPGDLSPGPGSHKVGELNATKPHTLNCVARVGPRVKERERETHTQRQKERQKQNE